MLTCTLISGLPSVATPFWAAMFSNDRSRMYWVTICSRGVGRRSPPFVSSAMSCASSAGSRIAAGSSTPARRGPPESRRVTGRRVQPERPGRRGRRPPPPRTRRRSSRPSRGAGRGAERPKRAARTVIRAAPRRISAPHRRDQQQQPERVGEEARDEQQQAGHQDQRPVRDRADRIASVLEARCSRLSAASPWWRISADARRRGEQDQAEGRPQADQPPTSMNSAISTIGSARRINRSH